MNLKFHHYFMDVAKRTAELSYARRNKVGSVAVRDRRIIACGYNGTGPGEDNNCEISLPDGSLQTKSTVLHSELNLINFAEEQEISLFGCDLYITLLPCVTCAGKIIDAGFFRVFYDTDYRIMDGLKYLNDNGVTTVKLEDYLK